MNRTPDAGFLKVRIQTLTSRYAFQSIFLIAGGFNWELLGTKIMVLTLGWVLTLKKTGLRRTLFYEKL